MTFLLVHPTTVATFREPVKYYNDWGIPADDNAQRCARRRSIPNRRASDRFVRSTTLRRRAVLLAVVNPGSSGPPDGQSIDGQRRKVSNWSISLPVSTPKKRVSVRIAERTRTSGSIRVVRLNRCPIRTRTNH